MKPRQVRQTARRAIRRSLGEITPSTCHSQQQSPLFSMLPPEIRHQIFTLALKNDLPCPRISLLNMPIRPPRRRPQYSDELGLLQTCKLIYYETWAIPLSSTTFHFLYGNDWGWYGGMLPLEINAQKSLLSRFSKQQKSVLYHLHVALSMSRHPREGPDGQLDLSYCLVAPPLQWRRITVSFMEVFHQNEQRGTTSWSRPQNFIASFEAFIDALPVSCEELNMDFRFEFPYDPVLDLMKQIQDFLNYCKDKEICRADGVVLKPVSSGLMNYTGPRRRLLRNYSGPERCTLYYIQWRSPAVRREYMRYDCVDCLSAEQMKAVPY
jgi:hypothetical protein